MTIVFAVWFSAASGILTAAVMKFTNNLVFVFVNVVTTSLLLVLSHFTHELDLNTYQIGGMLEFRFHVFVFSLVFGEQQQQQ